MSHFDHIEEAWGLDGNPFPHAAMSAGWKEPYSEKVFENETREFREKIVGIIESSILPDIDFRSRKDPNVAILRIEGAYFFSVPHQVFVRKSTGHTKRFGMVGDRDIAISTFSRSLNHFLRRVLAVCPVRVHM